MPQIMRRLPFVQLLLEDAAGQADTHAYTIHWGRQPGLQ